MRSVIRIHPAKTLMHPAIHADAGPEAAWYIRVPPTFGTLR
jgi:hypothetical protein